MKEPAKIEDHPARQAYLARQHELADERAVVVRKRLRLRAAIFISLVLLFILYDQAAHHDAHSWPILIPMAALAGLTLVYLGLQSAFTRLDRLDALYLRNLARVDGTRTQSGQTGEEFRTATHLYDRDLNILGPDSLFGLLATTRTGIGQRGLARLLLESSPLERSVERQQAVRELTPSLKLREEIALLGASSFQEVQGSFFDGWLAAPPPAFHPAVRPVLVVTSILLLGLLVAGLAHLVSWTTLLPNLAAVAAIQIAASFKVRQRVLPLLEDTQIASQTQMFADGLALLQRQSFTDPTLRALQQVSREPDAVAAIQRIQNQFVIIEQRRKNYFVLLSALLAAGTHAAISIANWKRTYAAPMQRWLEAWAEFEALNALATYAFEHPEDVYPELLDAPSPICFEATGLGHPLIPDALCVRNDVELNAETRFYLISGSNMAGKSTLLRAIGINAVLAFAGAPVHAGSLRLTPMAIGASLALTDSLAEGKSKFLAEVHRLHDILEASRSGPTLFLIDELFSGTNSADRRTAAEAVLETLLRQGAIGALSTHDLALTDLAHPGAGGVNLHMASPDDADPLAFDYTLKPGVNQASNALAIIRMMGIKT